MLIKFMKDMHYILSFKFLMSTSVIRWLEEKGLKVSGTKSMKMHKWHILPNFVLDIKFAPPSGGFALQYFFYICKNTEDKTDDKTVLPSLRHERVEHDTAILPVFFTSIFR